MLFPAMYHWSSVERRDSIRRHGLVPFSEPTVNSGTDEEGRCYRFDYVAFAPTPSSAWGLSGGLEWVEAVEAWDLWQVRFTENDEVHVQPVFGNVMREVRVRTTIPADRCWWVATRPSPGAEAVRME